VLGAHTTSAQNFSGDDVHFLQSTDLLATAIERRQLEEELRAATGREHRRIGQDLHDGPYVHCGAYLRLRDALRDLFRLEMSKRLAVEQDDRYCLAATLSVLCPGDTTWTF
jgi:GAF domain-containing protein